MADASRSTPHRPVVSIGYVWVGDPDEGMVYLATLRGIGTPREESVTPMSYLALQTIGDERHHHGRGGTPRATT